MRVAVEDSSQFTKSTGRGNGLFKMDVVIPSGLRAGDKDQDLSTKSVLIDITVVNPAASRCIEKLFQTPGSALEERATTKAKHYAGTFNPSRYTLLTVAFSACAGLGKGTNQLIRATANHMAYDEFSKGNYDNESAFLWLKAFYTNKIRRRFTFGLTQNYEHATPSETTV